MNFQLIQNPQCQCQCECKYFRFVQEYKEAYKNMCHFSIVICVSYGLISILQTLNAKLLFKTLQFNYSSFIFIIERLINILVLMCLRNNPINMQHLKLSIPYSLLMCTTNLLTSFCITVMPLESFVSFKKFLILFVLMVSCLSAWLLSYSLPDGTEIKKVDLPLYKIISVILIVIGGIMIGFYSRGTALGYSSSMLSNVMEALSLQYCSYLSIYYGVSPTGLLLYNSILSLPYYLWVMIYEHQFSDIWEYMRAPPKLFFISLVIMIILGSLSELTANLITMWISPFEKATVSNIKDLLILAISVRFFHEMQLVRMNELGIFFCLIGSALFSLPALLSKDSSHVKHDQVLQKTHMIAEHNQANPTDNSVIPAIEQEKTSLLSPQEPSKYSVNMNEEIDNLTLEKQNSE